MLHVRPIAAVCHIVIVQAGVGCVGIGCIDVGCVGSGHLCHDVGPVFVGRVGVALYSMLDGQRDGSLEYSPQR
jgi:hypothetical protein